MGMDFEEVSVHEASIVTFPANSQAGIKAIADRKGILFITRQKRTGREGS